MTRLSLRVRIFLFFVLQGLGGVAIVLAALWLGNVRAQDAGMLNGFMLAAIFSSFGLVALAAGIWLLFDENIAKPIEALAAGLRAQAHAGARGALDADAAPFLGDLGPAAGAVARALSGEMLASADRISSETARLSDEKARLTAMLTEIPVAMMLVNAADRIVLYDGQAAEVLGQLGAPRLNAPLTDYFAAPAIARARAAARDSGREQHITLLGAGGAQSFQARWKPMDGNGALLIVDEEHVRIGPEAARPLVYDFALLESDTRTSQEDTDLGALTFTVFDTETTGLLPHKDAVVQIGAVRVVHGRIVPGETFDQLVDPDRSIPSSATRVHGITDSMVAHQPKIAEAGRRFNAFARDSVLVAHNAPFDMAFLHRDANAMGVSWKHPILDTVLLSAVLFGTSQTHTLDALCVRLDVTISEKLRHTAPGDALATAEVLVKLLPMLRARGLYTLNAVIGETRRHGRLLQDMN